MAPRLLPLAGAAVLPLCACAVPQTAVQGLGAEQ